MVSSFHPHLNPLPSREKRSGVKNGDDSGVPGVVLGNGYKHVSAEYHFKRRDIPGNSDVVKIGGQRAHELNAGSVVNRVVAS
jgi:hypothetical protein